MTSLYQLKKIFLRPFSTYPCGTHMNRKGGLTVLMDLSTFYLLQSIIISCLLTPYDIIS